MRSVIIALLISSCTALHASPESGPEMVKSHPKKMPKGDPKEDKKQKEERNKMTFMWGTSSSAFQIEGSSAAGGRTPSIWDAWTKERNFQGKFEVTNNATADTAADDYKNYEHKTVPLLQDLGAKWYRMSISWSRVVQNQTEENPRGDINAEGVEHYKKLFASLKKAGVEPVVTMWHWDTPKELEDGYGGFLNRELMPKFFGEYAKVLLENFGKDVNYWITLHEPMTVARGGYSNGGHHPPGRCSDRNQCKEGNDQVEPYTVGHNMILAHAHAFQAFKELKSPGTMGIALNGQWCEPLDAESVDDRKAAHRCRLAQIGWFFDPLYYGRYPVDMRKGIGNKLPHFTPEEKLLVHGAHMHVYFMNQHTSTYATYRRIAGYNAPEGASEAFVKQMETKKKWDHFSSFNVTTSPVDLEGNPIGRKSNAHFGEDSWLSSYPLGLRKMQKWITDRYTNYNIDANEKMKIIVNENGWGEKDEKDSEIAENQIIDLDRCNYFRDHIGNMSAAVYKDGVNVIGYFAKSLTDDFEWLQGYTTRFGLTYVDFKTQLRQPKLSFRWLAKHVMPLKDLPPPGHLPPCSVQEFEYDRSILSVNTPPELAKKGGISTSSPFTGKTLISSKNGQKVQKKTLKGSPQGIASVELTRGGINRQNIY